MTACAKRPDRELSAQYGRRRLCLALLPVAVTLAADVEVLLARPTGAERRRRRWRRRRRGQNPRVDLVARLSPYVRLAHDFPTRPGFQLAERRIADHALLYFRSGEGRFRWGGEERRFGPATLFVVRPGVPHAFGPALRAPYHMLNLHLDLVERGDSPTTTFHGASARRLPPAEVLPSDDGPLAVPATVRIADPVRYEALFRRVHDAWIAADPVSRLRAKATMIELLAWLAREHVLGWPPATRAEDEAFNRVLTRVARDLRARHPVATLAAVAGMSRSAFSAGFRRRFGVAPAAYVRACRVERARALLGYERMPVKAVAAACGFATVHHFARVFTAATGTTPAAYARRRRD